MAKLPSRKAGVLRKIVTKKVSDLMSTDSYPQRVTFSYKHLPEAKDWKPGEKYHVCLEVEQDSSNKDSATFTIVKVGTMPDEEDKKDNSADEAKEGE